MTDLALAAKLRQMAASMEKAIEEKGRPMTQNPTPKRMREYKGRCIDARDLERGRQAMLALANAWEAGTVPQELRTLKTKAAIMPLVRRRTDSNGYYDIHELPEYRDKSAAGVALQQLLERSKDAEARAAEAEQARRQAIIDAEERLRFMNIDGFFPTPGPIIARMLAAAELEPGMLVLEPSAGKGDIADAARSAGCAVHCMEINYSLNEILRMKGHTVIGDDCIANDGHGPQNGAYDRVLMNPPFEHSQDAEHVLRAFQALKPGGRLVAVVSAGVEFRNDRKSIDFRELVEQYAGSIIDLPQDAFSSPGAFRRTAVQTKLVVIDMPPARAIAEAA